MTSKEADDLWTASRETLNKACTVRDEAIAAAKAEYHEKIREANVAFQHANEAYHRAFMDRNVVELSELAPLALAEMLDDTETDGTRTYPECARWLYTKPDGTLSWWGRKIQAHARKMKEDGRL